MRKTLIALSIVAMACSGSKQDLVGESLSLARHLDEPRVLVSKLYDPVAGAEGTRGTEREVLERALAAVKRDLGIFVGDLPGDRGGVYSIVGMNAGSPGDWSFCRLTRTVFVNGRFEAAGPGRVRFSYCPVRGREVLRSVDFGVKLTNLAGMERMALAQAHVMAIVGGSSKSR